MLRTNRQRNGRKQDGAIQFTDLPDEMVDYIGRILVEDSLTATVKAMRTNRKCYAFFQPKVEKIAKEFCDDVIYSDYAQVEEKLDQDPNILLVSATLEDTEGCKIRKTGWQIALAREDFGMLNLMEPYFAKVKNGIQKQKEQYQEQFPNGRLNAEEANTNALLAEFKIHICNLLLILSKPKTKAQAQETQEALQAFYQFIETVVTNKRYLNYQFYITALELFKEQGTYTNTPENFRLYFLKVIHHIHKYLCRYDQKTLLHEDDYAIIQISRKNQSERENHVDNSLELAKKHGEKKLKFMAEFEEPKPKPNKTCTIS